MAEMLRIMKLSRELDGRDKGRGFERLTRQVDGLTQQVDGLSKQLEGLTGLVSKLQKKGNTGS